MKVFIKEGKTSLDSRAGLEFCYMEKGIPINGINT